MVGTREAAVVVCVSALVLLLLVPAVNGERLPVKTYTTADGLALVRVIPNFVIQGGETRGDQNGGPGFQIRDEINLHKYETGTVDRALSGKDTGGSQFAITHSPKRIWTETLLHCSGHGRWLQYGW